MENQFNDFTEKGRGEISMEIGSVAGKLSEPMRRALTGIGEEDAVNLYTTAFWGRVNTARALNRHGLFAYYEEQRITAGGSDGKDYGTNISIRLNALGRSVRAYLLNQSVPPAQDPPLSWYALALTRTERKDVRALGKGEFVTFDDSNCRLVWWGFIDAPSTFAYGVRELTERGEELLAVLENKDH